MTCQEACGAGGNVASVVRFAPGAVVLPEPLKTKGNASITLHDLSETVPQPLGVTP
jgi:hypothetical protein